MKIGDLVRHPGGRGENPAIGIIVGIRPEHGCWEVHELCGEYIGLKTETDGTPADGWFVISESPLTDRDRPDTLQG